MTVTAAPPALGRCTRPPITALETGHATAAAAKGDAENCHDSIGRFARSRDLVVITSRRLRAGIAAPLASRHDRGGRFAVAVPAPERH